MYAEDALLPISGLQHLLFCERQCALIHIEMAWAENLFTMEGRILHERVDSGESGFQGEKYIARSLPLRSLSLGLSGVADVVEFGPEEGFVHPVEYKRGRNKAANWDRVQLCAQAMCLEEMLKVTIAQGALFYGQARRRTVVMFDQDLRMETSQAAKRFHELVATGITPAAQYQPKCDDCSLVDLCLPKLSRKKSVNKYLATMLDLE